MARMFTILPKLLALATSPLGRKLLELLLLLLVLLLLVPKKLLLLLPLPKMAVKLLVKFLRQKTKGCRLLSGWLSALCFWVSWRGLFLRSEDDKLFFFTFFLFF